MRRVTGPLGWVARPCRHRFEFSPKPTSKSLTQRTCESFDQALDLAHVRSDAGTAFRSDAIVWDSAVVVTVSDASFAAGSVNETGDLQKPHHSHKGFTRFLVDPEIRTLDEAACQGSLECSSCESQQSFHSCSARPQSWCQNQSNFIFFDRDTVELQGSHIPHGQLFQL